MIDLPALLPQIVINLVCSGLESLSSFSKGATIQA